MALTHSRSGLTWLRSLLRRRDDVADVEEIELEDEDLEVEDLVDQDDDDDDDEDDEGEW